MAILDKNNIWAVGEIYTNTTDTYDSLGHYINPYNMVHWDGNKLELKRLMAPNGIYFYFSPIRALYSVSATNTWFENWQYNGSEFNSLSIPSGLLASRLSKIWASQNGEIYFADLEGTVLHYSGGSKWSKVETGFNTPIYDVLGVYNPNTGEKKIIMPQNEIGTVLKQKIVTIDSKEHIDSIKWGMGRTILSMWSNSGNVLFTAGEGVFQNLSGSWVNVETILPYYTNNIRGTGLNDVFVCGDFGLMAHFNGVEWHSYPEVSGFASYWQSIAVNNDCIVAVGSKGQKAIIAIGTRTK